MKNFRGYVWMSVLSTILFTAGAPAEDFPQATALKQSSVTRGFGQSALPVLHRVAGPSQDSVRASLLNAVCPDCQVTARQQGHNLQVESDRLFLSISADGTAAEFRDLAVAARSHSLARPLAEKMSAAALQRAGQAFISSKLAGSIVLGENEALVPLLTDYRVEGLQNLSTGAVNRSVVANRILFGRTLHGVPVVGNGSTVVVTFANDGAVESFRYDWPQYESVASQSLVAPSTLLSRIQAAVSAHSGVAPAFTASVPDEGEAARSVDLNTGTKLESMQCGYYDAGAASGLASVQPGCMYRAVYVDNKGVRAGYAGAVPGGVQFASDARWAESRIVQ